MQLHYFALLATAITLNSVDALVSTNLKPTQAISPAADKEDMPVKRLLRSYDEEERLSVQGVKSWASGLFKSNGYTKLSKQLSSDKSAQLSKQLSSKSKNAVPKAGLDNALYENIAGQTLVGAFTTLGLNKLNPKDLLSSKDFSTWVGYMMHTNRYADPKDAMTVAKFLRTQFDDTRVVKIFAAASRSDDPMTKQMGQGYMKDLLNVWAKADKKPADVATISKSLAEMYKPVYKKALDATAKKAATAKDGIKPNRFANVANVATP